MPGIAAGLSPPHDARGVRADDSCRSSIARSGPCRQALADAGLEPKDIDEAVLVGGSTRIPLVRRMVARALRPHAAQRSESRRSRRARRGRAGRHPRERPPRDAAARRDAAVARHRDDGRRDVEDHPAQLDDSGERPRDVHDRSSTTRRRSTSTCCRASASWPPTAARWRGSACAAFRRCPPACRASRCGSRSTRTASSA